MWKQKPTGTKKKDDLEMVEQQEMRRNYPGPQVPSRTEGTLQMKDNSPRSVKGMFLSTEKGMHCGGQIKGPFRELLSHRQKHLCGFKQGGLPLSLQGFLTQMCPH